MVRLMHVKKAASKIPINDGWPQDLGYVQHGQSHKGAPEHMNERIACANTMKPPFAPLTLFLSRLIGLFAILVVLSLVTHKQATVDTLTTLVRNPPLLLIFAMVWLIAGLAMVLGHNVWSGGALPVVVTLVGWLILIRGLLLLFLSPAAAIGLFKGLHLEQLFYIYLSLSLLFGVYLTYSGFRPR
jgi:hypothetical protein